MMLMPMLAQVAAADSSMYLLISLALLGVAIALAALELFIPTGGVLAIMTVAAAIASVAAMFMHDATWGGVYTALLLAGAPFAVIYGLKLWSATPIARRVILHTAADADERTEDSAPVQRSRDALRKLIGSSGVTLTALRPVGFARIGKTRVDALAENGFIEAGQSVEVIDEVDGQLRVRQCSSGGSGSE